MITQPAHATARSKILGHAALRWSKTAFTPLSLLVIGIFVWRERDQLAEVLATAQWWRLVTAVALWMLSNALSPWITTLLFRSSDLALSYRNAARIHCLRLPGKYLPGGIWHSVGRAADYHAGGHSAGSIGLYFVLENALLLATTILLSSFVVAGLAEQAGLRHLLMTLGYVGLAAWWLLPWLLRAVTHDRYRLHLASYFSGALLLCCYWALLATSFALYLGAFDGLALETTTLQTGSVYIFSWCAGYVALFAPQGIGIAEFVSTTFLAPSKEPGALLAVLLGFRVMGLAADMLCWLIALLIQPPESIR
jgi:hypothetical protein